MQTGSDKHGPLHDDALKAETAGMETAERTTRAEEWRDPEPPGEDQPDVDRAPDGDLVGGTPEGMDPDDVAGRSELAVYLGRAYPADRDALLAVAREAGAPDGVLDRLAALPADRTFDNVQDVWSALGGGTEQQRF